MSVEPQSVQCPYCGETFETLIDTSAGDQEYIEDCAICCRPITFRIGVDWDGNVHVDTRQENDA